LLHPWGLLWAYLLWSRCTEKGFVFLKDAHDKIGEPISHSNLLPRDRLILAFKSYIELALNFSMLSALSPAGNWMTNAAAFPHSVTDVLYFSATTITTGGNGAMIPGPGLLQLLSSYEIFCGLILLVVCFTIYTGLKKKGATCY
jgi:voltage-gated potassium channel